LFRALKHFTLYLVGAPKLVVEVDASSIKGMLNNPDVKISSPMNQWIREILEHSFKLVHVPGQRHQAPDALSRHRYTEADGPPESDPGDSSDDEPPPPPEESWNADEETLYPPDEVGRRHCIDSIFWTARTPESPRF